MSGVDGKQFTLCGRFKAHTLFHIQVVLQHHLVHHRRVRRCSRRIAKFGRALFVGCSMERGRGRKSPSGLRCLSRCALIRTERVTMVILILISL